MKHKHTSGEWRISEDLNENLFGDAISVDVLDEQDFPIATVDASPIIHDWQKKYPNMHHWADGADDGRTQIERPAEQVVANARLIAAAPDLLEALIWYVETDEVSEMAGNEFWLEGRSRARAAIAKATGEPQ